MATDESETTRSPKAPKSISSKSGSRKKKPKVPQQDMAAMRHMRLVVESIADDTNLSTVDKANRLAKFECLMDNVEKRLHYNPNKSNISDKPPDFFPAEKPPTKRGNKTRKKGSILQSVKESKKKKNATSKAPGKKAPGGVLEKHDDERGEVEAERGSSDGSSSSRANAGGSATVGPRGKGRDQPEGPESTDNPVPEAAKAVSGHDPNEDESSSYDDNAYHDPIGDARAANSIEYEESVCSARSISTFERDFIGRIAAEQEEQNAFIADERSISTFEKDIMTRQSLAPNAVPPMQVVVSDAGAQPQHDDDDEDDLTVDERSISTFERDFAAKGGAPVQPVHEPPKDVIAPNNSIMNRPILNAAVSEDDRSVSTFEKDFAARYSLSKKLDHVPKLSTRSPATKPNGAFNNNTVRKEPSITEQSKSTFEKDAAARDSQVQKINPADMGDSGVRSPRRIGMDATNTTDRRQKKKTSSKKEIPPSEVYRMQMESTPKPFVPPCEISVISDNKSESSKPSQYGFEKDKKKNIQKNNRPLSRKLASEELLGFERDVSRNMSRRPMDKDPMPKIDEFVVTLSPNAIDRGVGKPNRLMNLLSKGLCQCGLT